MLILSHCVSSTWDLNHLSLYALQQISTGHSHDSHPYPVSQRAKVRRAMPVRVGEIGGHQGSGTLILETCLEVSLGTGHSLSPLSLGFHFFLSHCQLYCLFTLRIDFMNNFSFLTFHTAFMADLTQYYPAAHLWPPLLLKLSAQRTGQESSQHPPAILPCIV